MDSIKDTRGVQEVSKLLDNQQLKTNPFGQNVSGEQAYRRAERIATALHLLTNHIPDDEPARSHARGLSREMLSIILSLRDGFRASGGVKIRSAHACIRELISLIKILAISGFISFQNAETMNEALDELGHFLAAAQRTMLAENVSLSTGDFAVQRDPHIRVGTQKYKKTNTQETIKDTKDTSKTSSTGVEMGIKDTQTAARSLVILNILKTGPALGIKDIAAYFPEVSEKTVLRVLNDMIVTRSIRAIGEKRWRKYLIQQ